ncbi:Casparian strip membrane protein domain [Dillenia turbinata]|uniref:CASP-like protein n=1 Tax=Dillenia turbinata TaxID=194707 RepID=A0AAN8VVE9_9MAGN
MESQYSRTADGMENNTGVKKDNNSEKTKRGRSIDFILRILSMALTLVAAILAGTNKETQVVPFTISQTLPPLNIPVTAKWHYLSAFVFYVVSNAVACSYAAISLLFSILSPEGESALTLTIIILDVVIMGLLFSADGAVASIGVISLKGNSHVQWGKVCNVFHKFCNNMLVSGALSFLGSCVFLLLIVLSILNIHKKSRQM